MSQAPDFGIYIPQVSLSFSEMLLRAKRCEENGYASFWLFDHLYTPGLPDKDALEGWTLATALLTSTTSLRVGHLVLNNNFRHPALVARMATTLDVISGGRFELGIGSGSNELEHHQAGLAWNTIEERSAKLAEALELITQMFDEGPTEFQGEYYQVTDLPNLPLSTQRPRPPITVGGIGKRYTLPLVSRYADMWNVPTYGLGKWRELIPALEEYCDEIDRDPAEIRHSLESVMVLAPDEASLEIARSKAERRYSGPAWGLNEGGFVGTPAMITDRIGQLIEYGITYFVFFPADRGDGEMIELFAEEVARHFPVAKS